MIWLGLLFTYGVGLLLLPVRNVFLAFPAGAAATSLQLLLYDLMRIPWNRWTVITPWVLGGAAWCFWRRPALSAPQWRLPGWMEWPAIVFGVVVLAAWVPYERLMPLNEWDAVMIWMFKGKAFYLDGGIAPYLGRASEFLGNAAYPLLVPLYATFLYIWSGEVSDHAAKFLSPCFFASLAGGFYHLVRRFASRAVSAVFTAMLMGVYIVNFVAFHYAGYADTAVAAGVLLGTGFLYAWFRENQLQDFLMAVVFASIAAWAKNEGLFFLGGFGLAAAARLAWKRDWNWQYWTALTVLPGLAVVPWAVARSLYGIRRPGQLSSEIVQTNVASYWPTLQAVVEHAFAVEVFNLVFPLWLAAAILHRRAGLDWKYLLLPAFVVWQLFGVTLVYVTGPVNLQWMIGSSLDRVLSQIVPMALLGAAVAFGAYDQAAESCRIQRAAPAKKRRRRS